jgi:phage tail-like protein
MPASDDQSHDADFQSSFFSLQIDDLGEVAWFTGCSGLSLEYNVMTFKQTDGVKVVERKRPGQPKYGEITLKRGFTTNRVIHDWFKKVVDASEPTPYRTGSIVIYNRLQEEAARFTIERAWPSKLSVSDLSAAKDEVMIEELTIQHEFLDWVVPS